MDVTYTISFPHPSSHLARVQVDVKGYRSDSIDFVLPSWVPGSYKIRDFARHVQDFSAGTFQWRKTAKNRWRVINAGSRNIRVQYDVFCFEMLVQTSHVDDSHAFINPGNTFVYVDGYKESPVTVVVKPPRGWKVATGLRPVSGKKHSFKAPNYDIVLDSPIEAGKYEEWKFQVRKVPHRIVMHGGGNYDPKKLVADVKKICEAEVKMMRDIPYPHYTFIVHTSADRGGGLEHLNSTALLYPRFAFRPQDKYENWLELVAHEFFHLWNVKRIHPDMLGPFDYEKEVYTTLLWVMEGITAYYDGLFPTRAKIVSPSRYLRKISERIQKLEERPARLRQSLSASSFDTWIKLYQPNENAVNSIMSYYQKGELIGIPLDLEIRKATRNRKSLDDVTRVLYEEWGKEGKGFPEEVYQETVERVAGRSFRKFFDDYIHGTQEVDWNRHLQTAGLRLVRDEKKPNKNGSTNNRTWLGIQTAARGGRVHITGVIEDSPAWKYGLSAKDEVIAVDAYRVTSDTWVKRIGEHDPGDTVDITLARDGILRNLKVKLGEKRPVNYKMVPVSKPREIQKKVYEGWLWHRWKK